MLITRQGKAPLGNAITDLFDRVAAATAATTPAPIPAAAPAAAPSMWDSIPLWVKILGAVGIAYFTYTLVLAPKKGA